MHTARKTIAVVIAQVDPLGGGLEAELRSGVMRACRQHDVNLLIVAGRTLRAPAADDEGRNGVSDLLHPEAVDGVILMSGGLGGAVTLEELAAIGRACAPLPVCSAGVEVPGVPSVVIDRRPALVALLEHLISAHRRTRIALLGGLGDDPESRLRIGVYRDTLARHSLGFDPALVTTGAENAGAAQRAVEQLLDGGVPFDAVCTIDDAAAVGAGAALRHARLAAEDAPSLAALGDTGRAHLGSPPLTAIVEPRRDMAELAVRLLLHQLEGREVAPCTALPARLTLRRSCGCAPSRRRVFELPAQLSLPEWLERHRERLVSLLVRGTCLSRRDADAPRLLVAALSADVAGHRGELRAAIEQLGSHLANPVEHQEELQKAITLLRNELSAFASPVLEELWDEARQAIASSSARRYAERLLEIDSTYRRLSTTAERFSSTFDLSELRACVAAALREFGIVDALLCLYTDDSEEQLAPFLWLSAGRVSTPAQVAYPARQLLPEGFMSERERHVLHVSALVADAKPLGIAVFAHRRGLRVFDMLCAQIAGAIQTARLHRRIVQQTTLHERTLQERRAAAERMASLRALAGGVAHDLNNALGPLLLLPSLALSELAEAGGSGESAEQLRADLSAIRSAALRASQTIQDLLTLSRQGRTEQQPLDLNRAVASWLPSLAIGNSVVLRSELSEQPLVVKGAEAHLIRALSNLVQNAIEAVDGDGIVRVETRSELLRAAHVGYEVVPPGHYAVLSVRDSGKGISQALRRRLFEPFVSSKRLSGQSGSGLGLAVVHGVVKEHGAFIDVHSERGRGTTFSLYFPLTHEAPHAAVPVSVPPPGQGHILVVDDDPLQLRTTRRVLEHLGYEVTTLTSGETAYELLSSNAPESPESALAGSPFDVMLLDRQLGEAEDGLDLLARVRRLFPHQKALMASGEAPDERASAAIEQGLGWLTKPYTVNALAKAISSLREPSAPGLSAPVLTRPSGLDLQDRGTPGHEEYSAEDVHHSFTAMLSRARESLAPNTGAGSVGGSRRRGRAY